MSRFRARIFQCGARIDWGCPLAWVKRVRQLFDWVCGDIDCPEPSGWYVTSCMYVYCMNIIHMATQHGAQRGVGGDGRPTPFGDV